MEVISIGVHLNVHNYLGIHHMSLVYECHKPLNLNISSKVINKLNKDILIYYLPVNCGNKIVQ